MQKLKTKMLFLDNILQNGKKITLTFIEEIKPVIFFR